MYNKIWHKKDTSLTQFSELSVHSIYAHLQHVYMTTFTENEKPPFGAGFWMPNFK